MGEIKASDLSYPSIENCLQEKRENILAHCKELLPKDWLRGDYKELVELTIMYLEDPPADVDAPIFFHTPGAVHKARFMGKLIYCLKMVLLGQKVMRELEKGAVFGAQQLPKLERFAKFVVFCYIPWWLKCPLAADAPSNDLQLLEDLKGYASLDKESATSAFNAMKHHCWYINEDMISLAFFSENVTNAMKDEMAKRLLSCRNMVPSNRKGEGFGKPDCPQVDFNDAIRHDLAEYIGPGSWLLFKCLKIDSKFLATPSSEWPQDPAFLAGKEVVAHLAVTNDAAERGVKLASDFLEVSKDERVYQNVLQVVENHRKELPNQRKKRKESNKTWFLHL